MFIFVYLMIFTFAQAKGAMAHRRGHWLGANIYFRFLFVYTTNISYGCPTIVLSLPRTYTAHSLVYVLNNIYFFRKKKAKLFYLF